MIWKTTVQCGSLSSYVLSSFTLNFALFKKDKSRIQAPKSHMQCTFYSCPISAKQKYWILIGKKYIVSHLFDAPNPIDQSNKCNIFCSMHRTQSISPTNASTHHTQSISAHFKWWILIGKKYIVSHLFDAPHPIDQSNHAAFLLTVDWTESAALATSNISLDWRAKDCRFS